MLRVWERGGKRKVRVHGTKQEMPSFRGEHTRTVKDVKLFSSLMSKHILLTARVFMRQINPYYLFSIFAFVWLNQLLKQFAKFVFNDDIKMSSNDNIQEISWPQKNLQPLKHEDTTWLPSKSKTKYINLIISDFRCESLCW